MSQFENIWKKKIKFKVNHFFFFFLFFFLPALKNGFFNIPTPVICPTKAS